jgi:high affinity sulfate transporter 1
VFATLRPYRSAWLTADLLAGLTVWAVLVPESLAYASIAGVSPVIGLYAAPPALVLYAAFGSSRYLITGPMSATAALSAAAVADLATAGSASFTAYTSVLALVTGVLALLAGLLRLGFLASFISEPVLKGFIVGLALTIIIGQVPKLLGIPKGSGNFFDQLWSVLRHLGDVDGPTLAVGLTSLAIVLGCRRFLPVVPGPLVAVVFGIVAVRVLDLAAHGVAIVGPIAAGLPSIGLPQGIRVRSYFGVMASAAGIMLVGYAEGLGAARSYAARTGEDINANKELVALGAANVGSGLCSGMVVNGSLSKTAVDASAGGRSQLSSIVCAGLTVLTLLFLTSLFEDLPEATLSAIVIAALIALVDLGALRELYRIYTGHLGRIYGVAARPDFIAAVAALMGVLVFDTLPGLFIGITVSVLLLLYRSSHPHVAELGRVPGTVGEFGDRERHPANVLTPGVVVLRVESELFFANAEGVRRVVRDHARAPGVHAVVIDAAAIGSVDVTAARMVIDLARELERGGVRLALAHGIGQVRDMLEEAAVEGTGPLLLYPTVQSAVAALRPD